jgi:hypothetical protein
MLSRSWTAADDYLAGADRPSISDSAAEVARKQRHRAVAERRSLPPDSRSLDRVAMSADDVADADRQERVARLDRNVAEWRRLQVPRDEASFSAPCERLAGFGSVNWVQLALEGE